MDLPAFILLVHNGDSHDLFCFSTKEEVFFEKMITP